MAANHDRVLSIAGSTGGVPTGTYATLVAATNVPCSGLVLANHTDQNVVLATGAAGSEVDLFCVAPGTTQKIDLSLGQIPQGTRLAVTAVGTATASGQFSASLL